MHICSYNPQVTFWVPGSVPNLHVRKWAQREYAMLDLTQGTLTGPKLRPRPSLSPLKPVLFPTSCFRKQTVYLPWSAAKNTDTQRGKAADSKTRTGPDVTSIRSQGWDWGLNSFQHCCKACILDVPVHSLSSQKTTAPSLQICPASGAKTAQDSSF